ncbi:uncharacterized protein LOC115004660 [Cottoperca gobio]|uniref:Uncharacterized protein LOC115004660 n=1 Tax=Cottoperca gobio TaxID=56716 RepID=A0A6J2PA81_COTGO|nr:uncharacterized protein LOC115004660 [Cottoperca gobio]
MISRCIMNLWLSSHLLVAGLFLGCSALTPEECQPLVAPLSLADASVISGRSNFLVGYTDNEVFASILNFTQSSWVNFTFPPSSPNKGVMSEWNKMKGHCVASTVNVTIDGNTLSASVANMSSVFHMLPTSDGCLVMSINTTARNLDKILNMMGFSDIVTPEEVNARSLYLMGRESSLKDSELEQFKKQASCLGFSGEPNFIYNSENAFCAEGEGVKLKF